MHTDIKYKLTDFKDATFIAALIYVSKKKAQRECWLYVKECSFVNNTLKFVQLN